MTLKRACLGNSLHLSRFLLAVGFSFLVLILMSPTPARAGCAVGAGGVIECSGVFIGTGIIESSSSTIELRADPTTDITTTATRRHGILVESIGARGGDGRDESDDPFDPHGASSGDPGHPSGNVDIDSAATIDTSGIGAVGIFGLAKAGNGGNGGDGSLGGGKNGGRGGDNSGRTVSIESSGAIITRGAGAIGIVGQNHGGIGGNAGGGGLFKGGGDGGDGGHAGSVDITNDGTIVTNGEHAFGLFLHSVGGFGGEGGGSVGFVGYGGTGGSAGDGGAVEATNTNRISTTGDYSNAIYAQSVGGGGGRGGNGIGIVALGGVGGFGGNGNTVTVSNGVAGGNASDALIETSGVDAIGIFAQSVGGSGGDGGDSAGLVSIGGSGDHGGSGSTVNVNNFGTVRTTGQGAVAIHAQSVGGGGGHGGSAAGLSSLGGSGGNGGDGGTVNVANSTNAQIVTTGDDATGIFAQSVGGGGGDGGASIGVSPLFSVAIGGNGAKAGHSGAVAVTDCTTTSPGGSCEAANNGTITTQGDRSHGIHAQGIGGGGGRGGFAVALSGGPVALSAAFGGRGGGGGNGSTVIVNSNSNITTFGDHAHGISAESIGGGGGSGGFAVAGSVSDGPSISVALGGSGAGGGNGESVTVNAVGEIITNGEVSHGVFAQSIGGGGGNGGFSVSGALSATGAAAVAIGGTGAGGGAGGTVTVTADGAITTKGVLSNAIHAQSIGGGGGHGGFAVGAAITTDAPALSVGLGGRGGGGGSASDVAVTANGALKTLEDGSHAIFAQSVGGGGGSGGFSGAFSASFDDSAEAGISIGGSGGTAGHGKQVTVISNNSVMTVGDDSVGILAQSIGGGGGHGGFGLSASMSTGSSVNAGVSIGGSGGGGGNGDEVVVDVDGTIMTVGARSHGIQAQSIGGGGGSGGFSLAGTIGASSGSTDLAVSIGGSGGTASHGGDIRVTSNNTITTSGRDAYGVFIQSVGGGGGDGGMALSGAFSGNESRNGTFSLGGSGGGGGDGGNITANLNALVSTSGQQAHGVFAQSIGGGGGSGGLAGSLDITNGGSNTQANIAIGGSGAGGGTGGTVDVTVASGVITTGYNALGVFAQSVGGGGGSGGSAFTYGINLQSEADGKDLQLGVAVGGSGGNGAVARAVTVNTDGQISTTGDTSHAILAQSIGGGGGRGGNANSFSLFTPGGGDSSASEDNNGDGKPDGKKGNVTINVSVGGSGGSGNHGGTVAVTNLAVISTGGADSYGIFAQSIGAGGGEGGHGSHGTTIPLPVIGTSFPPGLNKVKFAKNWSVSVGGSGGSSGDGDAVTVTSGDRTGNISRTISTSGDGSFAVFAQSIGAGGGIGGYGGIGETGKIGIGGEGGAAGDGGTVDVDILGNVTTSGLAAHAIIAQSIGGGGGVAGNVRRGIKNTGIGLAFQRSGGGGGSGDDVTVTTDGVIQTTGQASFGILAQSIGGGGGVLGDTGTAPIPAIGFFGSVGKNGSAGDVTVRHNGTIMTTGDFSTGVFAQSSSADATGKVDVTISGNGIQTAGENAPAIFAESIGTGSSISVAAEADVIALGLDSDAIKINGAATTPIDVTIDDVVVAGGSGDAAALRISGGGTNTIASAGNLSALSGDAVISSTGDDTLTNTGFIAGNIDLGGGTNTIFNRSGATLSANPKIALGGGTLTNEGDISPGGDGIVGTTAVTGDFVQTATGRYLFDADFSRRASDLIDVTGTADLNGTLVVNLQQLEDGNDITIVTTAGGATLSGIDVADTLAINYGIEVDGNDVKLTVNYNFDIPGLSPNEQRLTRYLNRALDAGVSDAFNSVIVGLATLTDPEAYAAAVAAINPEEHVSDVAALYDGAEIFADKVLSCDVAGGSYAPIAEGQCYWARITQRRTNQDESGQTIGYKQDSREIAGGVQVAIAPDWRLGGAFGFASNSTSNDATYTSDGDTFSGGAVLKYTNGPWLFAGALTAGYSDFDGQRLINFAGNSFIAQSEASSSYINGRIRAAYLLEGGLFYAKPLVDIDITQLRHNGFSETGAGVLSASSDAFNETLYTIRPAVQIGASIPVGHRRVVRPFIEAGVAFHPESELVLPIRLAGASPTDTPFFIESSINETVYGIAGGLDLVADGAASFELRYDAEFAENYLSQSGSLKMSIDF